MRGWARVCRSWAKGGRAGVGRRSWAVAGMVWAFGVGVVVIGPQAAVDVQELELVGAGQVGFVADLAL